MRPAFACSCLFAAQLLGGCQGAPRSAWARVSPASDTPDDRPIETLLSDRELKSFLPETLGERRGDSPLGMTTRMGERALSEATRSYSLPGAGPDPSASSHIQLKIADALLEPRATQAVKLLAAEGRDGRDAPGNDRLILPGAVGYSHFDQTEHVAQAQVLVAGRFIASATVSEAEGALVATEALQAVDTLALARLAQNPQ